MDVANLVPTPTRRFRGKLIYTRITSLGGYMRSTVTAEAYRGGTGWEGWERMAGAGDSARREYERRLARDKARIQSNRGQRIAFVAVMPIAMFCAVRFGFPLAWDSFISSLPSTSDAEPVQSALDPDQLNLIGAVLALGATLSVWQQLFGRRQTTDAWRRGADGEVLTGRILDRLPDGYVVLHDLPMPRSRANIDHVVIGPTGAFTVETKHYKNGVSINRGHVTASGRGRDGIVDQALRQAHAVSGYLRVDVAPVVVVHGGVTLGWFSSPTVDGVRFCSAGKLRKVLTNRPAALSADEVTAAAERITGSDRHEPLVPIGPTTPSGVAADPAARAPTVAAGDVCVCGGHWVKRHRRSDGAAFFGCSRFPACRRTRAVACRTRSLP